MDYQRTGSLPEYSHWSAHQIITVGYMNIVWHLHVYGLMLFIMIKQCYYNDFAIIVVIRALSSAMWYCIVWEKILIFWKNILPPSPWTNSPACCMLGSFFASLPLKMETVCSSKTSLHVFQSMWCYITEGATLSTPNLTIMAVLLRKALWNRKEVRSRYIGFTKMV
jgi:hypothetical protein